MRIKRHRLDWHYCSMTEFDMTVAHYDAVVIVFMHLLSMD